MTTLPNVMNVHRWKTFHIPTTKIVAFLVRLKTYQLTLVFQVSIVAFQISLVMFVNCVSLIFKFFYPEDINFK